MVAGQATVRNVADRGQSHVAININVALRTVSESDSTLKNFRVQVCAGVK